MKTTLRFLMLCCSIATSATGFAQLNNGLIGYWSFDTTERLDHSGKNNHAIAGNAITGPGIAAYALRLDGSTWAGPKRGLNLGKSFTICLWVKPNGLHELQPLFVQRGNDDKRTIAIGLDGAAPTLEYIDKQTGYVMQSVGTELPEDTWTLLAVIFTGSHALVYKGDQQVASYETQLANHDFGPADKVLFGKAPPSQNGFRGSIDELLVYNRALSPEDLSALASGNLPDKKVASIAASQSAPKTTTKKPTTQKKEPCPDCPECPGVPTTLNNAQIEIQDTVRVETALITIDPFDSAQEDGDVVSINVNGVWVLEHYSLKNRRKDDVARDPIKLALQPNTPNYLISHAWNLGSVGNNTMTLRISSGKDIKDHHVYSSIGRSGAIVLIYDNP